jgi:hypothetical protein
MVEVEWKLPLTRFRVCSLSRSFSNDWMDNLRLGDALRWKVEIIDWEGRGVICEKPAPPRL